MYGLEVMIGMTVLRVLLPVGLLLLVGEIASRNARQHRALR